MIDPFRRLPGAQLRIALVGTAVVVGTAVTFAGCSKAPPQSPKESVPTPSTTMPQQGTGIRTQAQAGVGKRGQKLKDRNGMLTTPAKQIFLAEQKIMFMKAEQALQAFEVLNDRYPKSTKEYMDRVIKANYLTLPELPAGDRYEFDTRTHTLMVIQGTATGDTASQ